MAKSKKPTKQVVSYKTRPQGYRVFVIFGDASTVRDKTVTGGVAAAVSEFLFTTEEELDAFKMGVDEAAGWTEAEVYDTRDEAEQAVREIADVADEDEDDDGE